MVSLLRFKHGGARQTGVAVAAALRRMHTSGAWPMWLGDPLSDPSQAPGWGGVTATGGVAHDSGGGGGTGGGGATGGGDGGSGGRSGGGANGGDGGGSGSSGDRSGAASSSMADEVDAHGPDDTRVSKRRRLTRERGRRGGAQAALQHDDKGPRLEARGRRPGGPGDDG